VISSYSYLLPPLVAGVLSGFLCFLVAWRARQTAAHRYFALFLLSLALWAFLIFVMRSSPDAQHALSWERLVIPMLLLSTPPFYFFTRVYTRIDQSRVTPIVALLYVAAVAVLAVQNSIVSEMEVHTYGYAPIFKMPFYFLVVGAYGWVVLAVRNLYKAYRTARVYEERNRLLYILVGTAFPVAGTVLDIFPSLYPMSVLGNLAFGVLTTAAILRYHLLDISLVIRKGMAYLVVSALVAVPYVAVILLAARLLSGTWAEPFVYVLILVVLAVLLQPMWSRVQTEVDRIFFRRRWDSLRALEEFTQRTRSVSGVERPAHELVETIRSAAEPASVSLLLPSRAGDYVTVASVGRAAVPVLELTKDNPVIRWMDRHEQPLETRLLDLEPQFQAMEPSDREHLERAGVTLLVPLRMREHISGVLALGPKLAGTPYSREELSLLSMIAAHTAVLLDDARLYQDVRSQLELGQLRLDAFRTAASRLALTEDPERALQELVDTARSLIGARHGALFVWDPEGRLVRQVLSGASTEQAAGTNGHTNGNGHKVLSSALPVGSSQTPLLLSDDFLTKNSLGVPIMAKDDSRGALYFLEKEHEPEFSRDDERLAGLFAAMAEVLLDNAYLYSSAEQEKRALATILFSMTEGLAILEADRKVMWWNNAMATFTSIPSQQALGQQFDQVIYQKANDLENPQELDRLCDVVVSGAEAPQVFNLMMARPERRQLSVKLFYIPSEGEKLLTGLLVRDVTQERALEERRNSFISIASHELRTPMTTIVGFTEILLTRDVPKTVAQEWLRAIHRESLRLTGIVDDMLNISRIQSGKLSLAIVKLQVSRAIEEAVTLIGATTTRHEIKVDITSEVPEVWADRDKVVQVLTNLLSNAVKYSPAGGRIVISAKHDPSKEWVVVSVADQGIGIASEVLPNLFQSFQRVARPETEGIRGAGLGLYIVKSFVEIMGGQVWVESELNKGSTFFFSLPTRLTHGAGSAPLDGGVR